MVISEQINAYILYVRTILEAVVVEYVCERGGDYASDAKV